VSLGRLFICITFGVLLHLRWVKIMPKKPTVVRSPQHLGINLMTLCLFYKSISGQDI
jgi:hypothetical protein